MKVRGVRIAVLVIVVIASMLGFTLRLARYQIVDGSSYRVKSKRTTVQNVDIEAPRGQILDRYGRVLATSKVVYAIYFQYAAFPSESKKPQQINQMLLDLTQILKKNGETWTDTLPVSSAKPYAFTDNSKSTVKQLRSFLKADDSQTAGQLMEKLIEKYKLDGFTPEQQRALAGIHYEMDIREFSQTNTYTFATDVGTDTITKIRERSSGLPGVEIKEESVRVYTDGTIAPHTLGSVGPIYQNQLENYTKMGYSSDAIVGQGGIEQSMESQLHGTNGTLGVEIDNLGNIVGSTVTKAPKPGNNVVLTLDSDLQKLLEQSLANTIQQVRAASKGSVLNGAKANAGAAVVMNIKTGEVLAMVNYPSYDINTYKKNYSALLKDSATPLYNRCIAGTYRPGSTFKPITALAGLMSGAITGSTLINCPVSFTVGSGSGSYTGTDDEGLNRGNINVVKALSVSSNIFFEKLGHTIEIGKIDQTATMMGIGKKTGIEVPGELSGNLSGPDSKTGTWYPGDTLQTSIGQFETLITPVQLVSYISTLCNYGTRYQTHVVKSVQSYDNSTVIQSDATPKVAAKYNLSKSAVNVVREGMLSVTTEGTARSVFSNYQIQIAGKTGTAQIPNGYNGVFVAFAPYDDPEYAVAVVVEKGHNGYQVAPVAKDAFNYLFGINGQGAAAIPVSGSQDNQLLQ